MPAEIIEDPDIDVTVKMFADFTGGRRELRQTVAEDLLFVVNRFAEDKAISKRTSYQAMARVLHEQCEVSEDKTAIEVKTRTGGDVMQNPSDPDATYDGHKGPGYQAQIAETCSESNEQQLITAVDVEPAHKSDQDALEPMLDQLGGQGRTPETLHADGGYGRAEQKTDAFKENYAIRAGGESVNSGLKRKTGMGRLRTRGQPRVRTAVLFRCAGWNLFRALAALKKRGIRDFQAAAASFGRIVLDYCSRQTAIRPSAIGPRPIMRQFSPTPALAAA